MRPEHEASAPAPADIVVAKRSASTVYELSAVPGPPQLTAASHTSAVGRAKGLAAQQSVDVWYTEDHTHFTCIARYRVGASRT
jgi:hypothetical protein